MLTIATAAIDIRYRRSLLAHEASAARHRRHYSFHLDTILQVDFLRTKISYFRNIKRLLHISFHLFYTSDQSLKYSCWYVRNKASVIIILL